MTTEARFLCAVCGAVAGQVRLLRDGEPRPDRSRACADALADADALIRPANQAALVVDTFYGVASQPVSGERFGRVADAVSAADAAGLYALGYSYAPFHCPDCAASYCGEHCEVAPVRRRRLQRHRGPLSERPFPRAVLLRLTRRKRPVLRTLPQWSYMGSGC